MRMDISMYLIFHFENSPLPGIITWNRFQFEYLIAVCVVCIVVFVVCIVVFVVCIVVFVVCIVVFVVCIVACVVSVVLFELVKFEKHW